jgi:type 1 glutamine amidotransferase
MAFGSVWAAPPIRVLIVDGINNHDWQAGTRLMRDILEKQGGFTVDVSTSPAANAAPEAWDAWRPKFSRYQVVINNFNGGHLDNGVRWPAEVERALEAYVRGGGGLVVFHAANNAFLHWPAYNDMIGLGWRAKTFGRGIRIGDDGKPVFIPQGEGAGPGHPALLDFEIHLTAAKHPITDGLPRVWMHPREQLTHGQHGPAEGLTILTYAASPVTKQNEPMDWVRDYGNGRVYVTMLGHTWKNEPSPNFDDVLFQTLFLRGVEWAATGRVTIPVPKVK